MNNEHKRNILTELITTSLPIPTGVLPSEHESTSIGWFCYGGKDISKTLDAVHEEERKRDAEKKLKKEQSKLQTSEASNDQPN